MYAVITENDISKWKDSTGVLYHFPKRYEALLESGTNLIYYKGRIKDSIYRPSRLSDAPHYFGVAKIGKVYLDRESNKGDLFATIVDYRPFSVPVDFKDGGNYLEDIPPNLSSNYWRNGVRPISKEIYELIFQLGFDHGDNDFIRSKNLESSNNDNIGTLESYRDGEKKLKFVTTYERNPALRKQAIAIHGLSCRACGFNFGDFYGEYAEGFIHIHHIIPVSELDGPRTIDPETDLVPLCANCHSVVHRQKNRTLSTEELIGLIRAKKGSSENSHT
ncbi:restriction endonuclease [Pseudidiomarina aestuarii]|uniref:Restriction endonuclease n=1 Tax=Pseudidiomarina aestuarii TaxID=624146 RepID=A0A7Z6ZSB9_9GAMM|nr:HNH endonuclease [Pseudidiomarina aestuarii]RUO39241.1 restriction endonuclease [Pseudidiomarina aestuarii]